jgi:hypothetical protein
MLQITFDLYLWGVIIFASTLMLYTLTKIGTAETLDKVVADTGINFLISVFWPLLAAVILLLLVLWVLFFVYSTLCFIVYATLSSKFRLLVSKNNGRK